VPGLAPRRWRRGVLPASFHARDLRAFHASDVVYFAIVIMTALAILFALVSIVSPTLGSRLYTLNNRHLSRSFGGDFVSRASLQSIVGSVSGSRRLLLTLISFSLILIVGLSSAASPDFSGRWVFDPAQSEASMKGGQLLITQKEATVTVQMFGADGSPSFTLNFVTDGKPTPNSFGIPQTSAAHWDGEKLVVAWNQASAPPNEAPSAAPRSRAAAPFNWTWKLGPGGKTLINEVEMNPGPNASGEKWVFVRKDAK
jgi:hypothetical protein